MDRLLGSDFCLDYKNGFSRENLNWKKKKPQLVTVVMFEISFAKSYMDTELTQKIMSRKIFKIFQCVDGNEFE